MGLELELDPTSHGLTDEGILHIPGLLSRYVRLEDGQLAHYVTSGESGPAVILLHGGLPGSSGTAGWRFTMPFLGAHGFRVYAPDRPNFGLSDISKREYLEYNHKAQIEFIRKFADALGIDKFHVSGNSSGCVLSYQFLINHPDRVLSAAFIAGDFGDVVPQMVDRKQSTYSPNPNFEYKPYDGTHEAMKEMMEAIIYEAQAIWPELIDMRVRAANRHAAARKGLDIDPDKFREVDPNLHQMLSHSKGRLDTMTTPMICMYGLQDISIVVENGFLQDDALPNVQFFYPDECGHQGQTDQPDMFNEIYLDFFTDGKVSWKNALWAGVSLRKPISSDRVEEPAGGFPVPDASIYDSIEAVRASRKQLGDA